MIIVQWTEKAEGRSLDTLREGRVAGYVTDAHGKVCAIVIVDRVLRHVPLERLTVVDDTKGHKLAKFAGRHDRRD